MRGLQTGIICKLVACFSFLVFYFLQFVFTARPWVALTDVSRLFSACSTAGSAMAPPAPLPAQEQQKQHHQPQQQQQNNPDAHKNNNVARRDNDSSTRGNGDGGAGPRQLQGGLVAIPRPFGRPASACTGRCTQRAPGHTAPSHGGDQEAGRLGADAWGVCRGRARHACPGVLGTCARPRPPAHQPPPPPIAQSVPQRRSSKCTHSPGRPALPGARPRASVRGWGCEGYLSCLARGCGRPAGPGSAAVAGAPQQRPLAPRFWAPRQPPGARTFEKIRQQLHLWVWADGDCWG